MGYPTNIEWTDATWNPVGGCSIESPGCNNCYAMRIAGSGRLDNHPVYKGVTSLQKGRPVFNGKLTILPTDHAGWDWPLSWRGSPRPIMGAGMPSLIFVGDMADLFHEDRPESNIARVTSVCARSKHISQLLTKRADMMDRYYRGCIPNDNIWLGFSAERQREFDDRWSQMCKLANAGWTVFVSIEPMIGPVVLPADLLDFGNQIQVITGGESGPPDDRRPTDPDWMRAVRDQCLQAGVAYFTKQMTGKKKIPDDLMIRQFPAVKLPTHVAVTDSDPQMSLLGAPPLPTGGQ